ncbi:hypothetical protein M0R89_16065 [Halorussus limi]|uniref:Uncharacterized protein n=1 Tax=Halorussus limi TaxID=2938695 RepID=A0A8U0HTB2_9EURY|nr:hypothetical protein [Halorussus limi]UPV74041.1 hypothetical protein M0R89_16065 [Halorussus limi]
MSGLREVRDASRTVTGPLRSALAEIRTDARARRAALVAGAVVGLAAARVHWYGFFLGGALVGLVSTDAKRGLAAGLGFGLLAWAVFAGLMAANGGLMQYAGMGRLLYLSVAIPVGLSALGSLVRAVV